MKYINIPIYLNRFLIGVTGLLYLTVFYGLYAQIVLGAFQLMVALTLLFYLPKISLNQRTRLFRYWLFVILYAAIIYVLFNLNMDNMIVWIASFIVFPMSIAVYMTFILESFRTNKA